MSLHVSIHISVTEIGIDTDSHKDICSHIYGKTDTETDADAGIDASVSVLSDFRFSCAKETYKFKEPTNRSHPIQECTLVHTIMTYTHTEIGIDAGRDTDSHRKRHRQSQTQTRDRDAEKKSRS